MNSGNILRYFLGGNTADGFYSLYDGFVSLDDGDFLWIIKGGAGCGKSTFMKKIGAAAEKAGLDTEYVLCSGDPESLDGVYIPALKVAYMDGTAPHVADARIAAVDSAYLDLGAFYDREAIAEHKTELQQMVSENKNCYKKAYSLLSAAGSLRRGWLKALSDDKALLGALGRAESIAAREFGKKAKHRGSAKQQFLSANTYKGLITPEDSALSLCSRLYMLENRCLLGSAAVERLTERALDTGHDVIICPDPLTPELTQALIVPDLKLGFLCTTKRERLTKAARNIRLDNLLSGEVRGELRACEKLCDTLRSEAYAALLDAKRIHDELEKVYNPNVDFEGVHSLASRHIALLGL